MSRKASQPSLIPAANPTQWPDLVNIAARPRQVVKLADGREVDSASAEWRAECEARRVLRMPSKRHRHEYLHRVATKRGEASRAALEAAVMALWRAERFGQDDRD